MASRQYFERFASPFEQRTICREHLGFYNAVIIGATYEFTNGFPVDSPRSFFQPLRRCIEQHPSLGVVIRDRHTDKAFYERVPSIDLENHITILDRPSLATDEDESLVIEKVLGSDLDRPFPHDIPHWRMVVLPLGPSKCFIAFSYSHMIGDGPTGTTFHYAFLTASQELLAADSSLKVVETSPTPLPAPFDTPERLPISWSFLLAPLIDSLLPTFITRLLGLQLAIYPIDTGTWTGSSVPSVPKVPHSKIKLREIAAPLLQQALRACRSHNSKFTGMFQQLVFRALSKSIPSLHVTNFVAQVSVNMRQAIGVTPDVMGNFVSGCYISSPRVDVSSSLTEEDWKAASTATRSLAESAAMLQDQPIGLLRYVSRMTEWTLWKLGQRRECSFEVSNVGTFDSSQVLSSNDQARARITRVAFAQPGHVLSTPIAFNLMSLKGGSLVYTATWQPGALGVPEDEEDALVNDICASIDTGFENLE
ncbi:Alcohol acetyltransferase [Diatrype stigma]|uniref:Alcohol acetyltransferase n=1 Tax=Diatrype stigma TaxID=117547 RepID=A0AAN9YRR1_9PEZI